MYIKVDKYTYDCPFQVSIGDRVLLPPTYFCGEHWRTVTAVNADCPTGFEGQIKSVIAVKKQQMTR